MQKRNHLNDVILANKIFDMKHTFCVKPTKQQNFVLFYVLVLVLVFSMKKPRFRG